MTKFFLSAALPAILLGGASVAQAQKLNPAVIAIVDKERIFAECVACKAAQTQLQAQAQQIQARAQQLGTPLQTEAQAIEAAGKALNGKPADAALQARVNAFQQKQAQAQQEVQGREQTFNRNRAYVQQQIDAKIDAIIPGAMTARGATVAVDKGVTLASAASLDITADVMTALNAQLPSVGVTAPPPPQAPKPAAPGR
jgi:Skp family chaperone for outer membrane proteins